MWYEIVKKFFDEMLGKDSYLLDKDDLIYYDRNPKSNLDCWVRIDKNLDKDIKYGYEKLTKLIKNEFNYDDKWHAINNLMFSYLIISKDEDKAFKVMSRLRPKRIDMFEVNSLVYNGVKYYIVWD